MLFVSCKVIFDRFVQCWPALETNPYLIKDEETYEPPADPDSSKLLLYLAQIRLISPSNSIIIGRIGDASVVKNTSGQSNRGNSRIQ